MRARDLSSTDKGKSAESHERLDPQTKEDGPSRPPDPVASLISQGTGVPPSHAHTSLLSRGESSQRRVAAHYVLQLQRRYGNRFVQRALSLAAAVESKTEISSDVEDAIHRSRGGGHALDNTERTEMESAFGVDFSAVRVQTNAQADDLSRLLSARAFTSGQDIFFREGEYNPGSSS